MALDLRFDFNDEKEASAYRDRMLRWRQIAAYSPLLYHDQEPQRSTFILTLKQPIASAKPRSRPLPSLPFGTAAEYVLVEPMQTGGWKAQVYVAAPLHGTSSPTVVFKFIIPSRGDIPDRDTPGIVDGRYFRFPRDMAMGEAASYESLAEFQGSTLPYFYGVHEVRRPITHVMRIVKAQLSGVDALGGACMVACLRADRWAKEPRSSERCTGAWEGE